MNSINKVRIKKLVLPKKDSHDKKGLFDYFIGYRNETNTFSSTIIQKTSPNECIC